MTIRMLEKARTFFQRSFHGPSRPEADHGASPLRRDHAPKAQERLDTLKSTLQSAMVCSRPHPASPPLHSSRHNKVSPHCPSPQKKETKSFFFSDLSPRNPIALPQISRSFDDDAPLKRVTPKPHDGLAARPISLESRISSPSLEKEKPFDRAPPPFPFLKKHADPLSFSDNKGAALSALPKGVKELSVLRKNGVSFSDAERLLRHELKYTAEDVHAIRLDYDRRVSAFKADLEAYAASSPSKEAFKSHLEHLSKSPNSFLHETPHHQPWSLRS